MDFRVDNHGEIRVDDQQFSCRLRPVWGNIVLLVSKVDCELQLVLRFATALFGREPECVLDGLWIALGRTNLSPPPL